MQKLDATREQYVGMHSLQISFAHGYSCVRLLSTCYLYILRCVSRSVAFYCLVFYMLVCTVCESNSVELQINLSIIIIIIITVFGVLQPCGYLTASSTRCAFLVKRVTRGRPSVLRSLSNTCSSSHANTMA